MPDAHQSLAGWLHESRSTVAFTGAGISTESGIPDFRSPGGVWATSQPVYFDDFVRSATARYEYWRQKSVSHRDFSDATPNAAHRVLSQWEASGILRGVITQNIDGLHQLAGSRGVLELHGTARQISCLDCDHREDADALVHQFLETDEVPHCPQCGGLLKHATISFGQSLPEDVLQESLRWATQSSLFLAMGSSLVVHPAAGLPVAAVEHGARLVIINRDDTPLDSRADLVIRGALGDTLQRVAEAFDAL